MSKNITLMGASYSAVPAVTLPQTGGGTATFYDVDGSQTFTENGTYDVSALAEAVVNVSGGGGSSFPLFYEFSADKTRVTFQATYDDIKAAVQANTKIVYVNDGDEAVGRTGGVHTGWSFEGTTFTEGISFTLQDWDRGLYAVAYGYVNGSLTTRTRLSFPQGTKSINQNGTGIDVAAYESVDVAVSGGASNVVIGEFTTGSTTGATGSVSVPYTGSGFPLAAMVFVAGGMVNNTSTGNTDWYNSVHRYAVGQWTYHNTQQASPCNTGVTTWVFKNSTSNSQSYSRSSATNTSVRTSSAPSGSGATCVRMTTDGKTLKWYVSSSSYGLLASTKYTYIIIYSS